MCMYPELVIAPQAIQQMTKAHCQTVVDYEFERTFFPASHGSHLEND